jgi:hypothetical protein
MRGISIKALLIANAVYVVVLLISTGIAVTAAIVAVMAGNPDISGPGAAAVVDSSGLNIVVILCSTSIAAVFAGHIAGRIAKRTYALNGAMAVSLFIAFTLVLDGYEFVFGPVFGDPSTLGPWISKLLSVVLLLSAPLLGALGGRLAEIRQVRWNALSAEQRAAHGYRAIAIATVRWVLALAAGMAIYAAFINFVPLALGHSLLIVAFAVTFAIMFATLIVPASHRKIACMLFIAIAIMVPAEQFLRHSLLGHVKGFDAVILLVYSLGALMAYWYLRRLFRHNSNGRLEIVPQPTSN